MRRRTSAERGSISVVVVAGAAVVLVLTMGVADVARALTASARARAAADAAAQELAFPSGSTPTEVASRYAEANGGRLETCICAAGTFSAEVEVSVPVGPMFLSTDDRAVTGEALAVVDLPE